MIITFKTPSMAMPIFNIKSPWTRCGTCLKLDHNIKLWILCYSSKFEVFYCSCSRRFVVKNQYKWCPKLVLENDILDWDMGVSFPVKKLNSASGKRYWLHCTTYSIAMLWITLRVVSSFQLAHFVKIHRRITSFFPSKCQRISLF